MEAALPSSFANDLTSPGFGRCPFVYVVLSNSDIDKSSASVQYKIVPTANGGITARGD